MSGLRFLSDYSFIKILYIYTGCKITISDYIEHADVSFGCDALSVQQAVCTCLAGGLFGVLDTLKDHQGPDKKTWLILLQGSSIRKFTTTPPSSSCTCSHPICPPIGDL